MITKGDLVHQHRKAETSGIDHHFEFIHVVSDKEAEVYRRIVGELGVSADRFVHDRQLGEAATSSP